MSMSIVMIGFLSMCYSLLFVVYSDKNMLMVVCFESVRFSHPPPVPMLLSRTQRVALFLTSWRMIEARPMC